MEGYKRELPDVDVRPPMTDDFRAKLETPLVETAAELAARLTDVKPNPQYQPNAANGYNHCVLSALPPCHDSKSGDSFVFGDDPNGGIIIRCMSCTGGGIYRTVEDRLGVRIQMRRSDTGQLKWRRTNGDGIAMPNPITRKRKRPAPRPLHANPTPEGYTLADLFTSPRWILANGKQGAGFKWHGRYSGFRQSKKAEDGGVAVARYGKHGAIETDGDGRDYEVDVLAWGTLAQVKTLQGKLLKGSAFTPAIVLSGDLDTPADSAIGVVDFDYKPRDSKTGEPNDPEGRGAAWRDNVLRLLTDAGLPIWRSTSGNGFHAVFSAPATELGGGVWLREPQRYPPRGTSVGGAAVDLFAPGCKRLVAIRFEKPEANTDDSTAIPVIPYRHLMAAMATGAPIPPNDGDSDTPMVAPESRPRRIIQPADSVSQVAPQTAPESDSEAKPAPRYFALDDSLAAPW